MVRRLCLALSIFFAIVAFGSFAHALLPQTQRDLLVAEDFIRYTLSRSPEQTSALSPVLVATPQFYWEESKDDFGSATLEMLARVFPQPGALIPCAECLQNRTYVSRDNRMIVQNGELSLADLARLREQSGFSEAKSLIVIRETPSGVDVRLIAIDDGRILLQTLADSTKNLSDAQPPLRLAQEMDRRRRGEALSYVFMDIGVYPKGLFQLKWMEQWGDRNQHLTGLALGFFNPTGAIGGSYHYMLPFNRKIVVSGTAYYKLQGIFSIGSDSDDLSKKVLGQGMLQYAISGSYGVFVSVDTAGTFTAGFSLLNPVLMPFLL